MDNELSGSESDLLSQRPERADATWTGRRLVMKSTWSRSRGTSLAVAPSTTSIQCLSLGKI